MAHTKSFVESFCTILEAQKTISNKESLALQDTFHESEHEYFDDFLLEEELVTKEQLLQALSTYYKVPSFDVRGYFFDSMLVRDFPVDFLTRHAMIPLETDETMLIMIASEPDAPGLGADIRALCSYEAMFFVGIRQDIIDAIEEFHDTSLTDIDEEANE